MTEVTPPLENTRFSPFFDFTVLRPPGNGDTLFLCVLCFQVVDQQLEVSGYLIAPARPPPGYPVHIPHKSPSVYLVKYFWRYIPVPCGLPAFYSCGKFDLHIHLAQFAALLSPHPYCRGQNNYNIHTKISVNYTLLNIYMVILLSCEDAVAPELPYGSSSSGVLRQRKDFAKRKSPTGLFLFILLFPARGSHSSSPAGLFSAHREVTVSSASSIILVNLVCRSSGLSSSFLPMISLMDRMPSARLPA